MQELVGYALPSRVVETLQPYKTCLRRIRDKRQKNKMLPTFNGRALKHAIASQWRRKNDMESFPPEQKQSNFNTTTNKD